VSQAVPLSGFGNPLSTSISTPVAVNKQTLELDNKGAIDAGTGKAVTKSRMATRSPSKRPALVVLPVPPWSRSTLH